MDTSLVRCIILYIYLLLEEASCLGIDRVLVTIQLDNAASKAVAFANGGVIGKQTIKDMAERQGVTERLKAENQLRWVGMMNNIRSAAEEVVLNNLIYA